MKFFFECVKDRKVISSLGRTIIWKFEILLERWDQCEYLTKRELESFERVMRVSFSLLL
jgi:hypothetical protein